MAASEGVDLEWAIVELAGGRKPTRKYSKKVMDQATKCVAHIDKKIKDYKIYHSDESIPGFPSGGIRGNPEPKTDIVIISKSKKYLVSVKMAGGIQLASGEGKSTAALFRAAATGMRDSSNIQKLASSLEGLPTRLLSERNLSRILKENKKNVVSEFTKNKKIISGKSYEDWTIKQKPKIMSQMVNLVKDKRFYDAIIYEALSGTQTLKAHKGAAANSIVSPTGFYMIDSAYINKIKPKIKFDIRAKSRSGITSIAFRIETRGSI